MRYYMVVRQSRAGLWVPGRLLHSINVRDESLVYAVKCDYHNISNLGESKTHISQQTVLSPVPHKSWGCTCHLSIRINDRAGALRDLLKFLDARRINILFSQTGPAGVDHACVDIWGEVQDLRAKAIEIKKKGRDCSKEDYQRATRGFASEMFSTLVGLEADLKNEGKKFIYDTKTYTAGIFDVEEGEVASQSDMQARFALRPVVANWVRNLAINYFFVQHEDAYKLRYCAKRGAFRPFNDSRDGLLLKGPSRLLIAGFDPDNASVRFRPIEANQVVDHVVNYDLVVPGPMLPLAERGSRGLLAEVLNQYQETNIAYVRSSTERTGKRGEEGRITLGGIAGQEDASAQQHFSSQVRNRVLQRLELENTKDVTLEMQRTSRLTAPFRIFISANTELLDDLKEHLDALQDETGVDLVLADYHTNARVTENVREQLKAAHGFLQILSIPTTVLSALAIGHRKEVNLDLQWLGAEWMLAQFRALPSDRLADTSIWRASDWDSVMRIDRDAYTTYGHYLPIHKHLDVLARRIRGLTVRISLDRKEAHDDGDPGAIPEVPSTRSYFGDSDLGVRDKIKDKQLRRR